MMFGKGLGCWFFLLMFKKYCLFWLIEIIINCLFLGNINGLVLVFGRFIFMFVVIIGVVIMNIISNISMMLI